MTSGFFGDDAIDGSDDAPDRLGRKAYATHLAGLLERVAATTKSSVLALIGPWGGGKSSMLDMTLTAMRERPGWQVAEFNPWAYSGLDAMIFGFFDEVISVLPEGSRPKQLRQTVGRWVQRASSVGSFGGLVGVDLEGAVRAAGGLIAGNTSPSKQWHDLDECLRNADQSILVVLDDLDRLAPAELLLVFKLVRFLGRLHHVYYLLSYDERTLLDVLVRTDLCGGDERRARDYLEKIVQVRLDLPPLRDVQARDLLMGGLRELMSSIGVTPTDNGAERFDRAYERYLRHRLSTPRAIKRYLGQVDALFTLLSEEVDFYDFALLTFIRTFEPPLYAMLYRLRDDIAVLQDPDPEQDRASVLARWRDLLRLADVTEVDADGLLGVLGELFYTIPVASAGQRPVRRIEDFATAKSVGHRDYIERYFGFGVPDDEMPDAQVGAVIASLGNAAPDESGLARLRFMLLTDTDRTLRKMSLHRPAEADSAIGLLRLLATDFSQLPEGSRGEAVRLAGTMLRDRPATGPTTITTMASESLSGLLLVTLLLQLPAFRSDLQLLEAHSRWMDEQLADSTTRPFREASPEIRGLLIEWNSTSFEAVRRWVRQQVELGRWNSLDITEWLIEAATPAGRAALEFPYGTIDSILGVDYLIENCRTEIDNVDLAKADFANTPGDRRLATLYMLRQLRDSAPNTL